MYRIFNFPKRGEEKRMMVKAKDGNGTCMSDQSLQKGAALRG